MKRFAFRPVLALALALAAAGCSGNDGEITVQPAVTPLTDKGSDALFTIAVVAARDDGYAIDKIRVKITPDGKDGFDVACSVNDLSSNKKLDKGDTLTCLEGSENKLDPQIAGKEVEVELFATVDGKEERIGDATWMPAK